MAQIQCSRCGKEGDTLPFQPFNNDLGKRIHAEICRTCWDEWLRRQTALINHYGLNVREPDAKKFLMENTEAFLFGGGETEKVDTTKQGTIQW